MTLGLLTITHDEPETLRGMLASVRDLIDGPAFAFHIGEQEETAEILTEWGAEVQRKTWDGFDGSWTQLFALARGKADRFLYMQANSVLEVQPNNSYGPRFVWGGDPTPCYMVRYRRCPYEYRLPNLLRGDIEWEINAPVHGTLEPSFFEERRNLDGLVVQESDADGRRPEKLARYLPICEQMVKDNPTPRAVFYLARTYFDLGRWQDAIEMYERRVQMGGWDEEQWHAHYMKGVAQIRSAQFTEGRDTLLAAYLRRPTRAEPLHALCKSLLPPDDLLFVERDVYGSL